MSVNKKQPTELGFTLIEVLIGLVVLALVVGSFIPMLTHSEIWTLWAGDETVATNYANSIVETIKAHSSELKQVHEHYNFDSDADGENDTYQPVNSGGENTFEFKLDPDASEYYQVAKPENMSATLSISQYDDTDYYDDTITQYSIENLFYVDVTITVTKGEKSTSYTLCTVIGAE